VTARLESKVAVVTGAASGIGRGIADRLVQDGARVVFADINETGLAEATAAYDRDTATTARVDITVEGDVQQMVETAVEAFGRLDVAVNCAYGLGAPSAPEDVSPTGIPFCDQPSGGFAAVVDVGLVAPFRCIKHEARQMVAQGSGGAIVNIASINARQPADGMSSYCSAKAGLEMLTRCAALELGPHGIRVTGIGPGLIDTPMTAFLTSDPTTLETYLRNVPLGRHGQPADVAAAAAFLVSDDAAWISGDTLFVDGAQLTRGYAR
jgi:NAD(P)-dependent dehydrogenase (short-subunit alcohol dehydrogenase family)